MTNCIKCSKFKSHKNKDSEIYTIFDADIAYKYNYKSNECEECGSEFSYSWDSQFSSLEDKDVNQLYFNFTINNDSDDDYNDIKYQDKILQFWKYIYSRPDLDKIKKHGFMLDNKVLKNKFGDKRNSDISSNESLLTKSYITHPPSICSRAKLLNYEPKLIKYPFLMQLLQMQSKKLDKIIINELPTTCKSCKLPTKQQVNEDLVRGLKVVPSEYPYQVYRTMDDNRSILSKLNKEDDVNRQKYEDKLCKCNFYFEELERPTPSMIREGITGMPPSTLKFFQNLNEYGEFEELKIHSELSDNK